MKFLNNETGLEIYVSIYDDERQNALILLLAGKTLCIDNRYYEIRRDQNIFDVRESIVEIELIEIDPKE